MAQTGEQREKSVDISSIPGCGPSIFEDRSAGLQKPELSLEQPMVRCVFLTMGNKNSLVLEQELLVGAASFFFFL